MTTLRSIKLTHGQKVQKLFFAKFGGFVKKDDVRYPQAVKFHKHLRELSDLSLDELLAS